MKKYFLFILLIFSVFTSQSQTLEGGIFAGGSYYIGDLNPYYHFKQTQPLFGLLARYNINNRWVLRVSISRGALKGDDSKIEYVVGRDLKFNSNITEFAGVAEFNFKTYQTGSARNFFTPYMFGGLAIYYSKPKVGNLELRDYGTEGQQINFDSRESYNFTNLSIPFGMGFKYGMSRRICLSFEYGLRKTFKDYLDDVSKTYYLDGSSINPGDDNYNFIRYSDPNRTHQPYMQRGYSKTNDWYAFAGLTLTYKILLKPRNRCNN